MAVEPHDGASLPDVLVETNPLSDDPINEGDDHLRLVKITLVNFYTLYQSAVVDFGGRLDALELVAATGDADTLDGQHGAFYQDAANINAGILAAARLSGTYNINITGNAATATTATTAGHATTADTATNANNATTLAGLTPAQVVQNQLPWQETSSLTTTILGGMGVGSFNTQVGSMAVTVPSGGGMALGTFTISPRVSYTEPCEIWVDVRALPSNTLVRQEKVFEDTSVPSQRVITAARTVQLIMKLPNGTTSLTYTLRSVGGGSWREVSGTGSTPKASNFGTSLKVI